MRMKKLILINDSVDLLLFLENFRKIGLVTSILTMAAFSENHQDLTKSTESLLTITTRLPAEVHVEPLTVTTSYMKTALEGRNQNPRLQGDVREVS